MLIKASLDDNFIFSLCFPMGWKRLDLPNNCISFYILIICPWGIYSSLLVVLSLSHLAPLNGWEFNLQRWSPCFLQCDDTKLKWPVGPWMAVFLRQCPCYLLAHLFRWQISPKIKILRYRARKVLHLVAWFCPLHLRESDSCHSNRHPPKPAASD